MRQQLIIDADDTLWENNIYFERAFDEFVEYLDHSTLAAPEIRRVALWEGADRDFVSIAADDFTPIDATQIPTGEIRSVGETPFDFRQPKVVGERLQEAVRNEDTVGRLGGDEFVVLVETTPSEAALDVLADRARA